MGHQLRGRTNGALQHELMPTLPQLDLIVPEQIWKRSMLAKIEGLIPFEVFDHLNRCGEDEIYCTCKGCGKCDTFYYRCSLKFCPLCNWRIARNRADLLKTWVRRIEQPKHIVLTATNEAVLTRSSFRRMMQAFAKLRRWKVWREVRGGCVSMEVTNKGQGWHLHLHILADVRWMPPQELAVKWAKAMGHHTAFIKVKDARGAAYLGEVTKYVVKGAELSKWPAEEIAQFIHSIQGIKFFSTFGSLFKIRRSVREEMEAAKPARQPCPCGCSDFLYETDLSSVIRETRK